MVCSMTHRWRPRCWLDSIPLRRSGHRFPDHAPNPAVPGGHKLCRVQLSRLTSAWTALGADRGDCSHQRSRSFGVGSVRRRDRDREGDARAGSSLAGSVVYTGLPHPGTRRDRWSRPRDRSSCVGSCLPDRSRASTARRCSGQLRCHALRDWFWSSGIRCCSWCFADLVPGQFRVRADPFGDGLDRGPF